MIQKTTTVKLISGRVWNLHHLPVVLLFHLGMTSLGVNACTHGWDAWACDYHNTVCRLSWVTRSWFLEKYIAVDFFKFNFLSITSQGQSSSIIFERRQTTLWPISPKLSNWNQNNHDGQIAQLVKIWIICFGGNCSLNQMWGRFIAKPVVNMGPLFLGHKFEFDEGGLHVVLQIWLHILSWMIFAERTESDYEQILHKGCSQNHHLNVHCHDNKQWARVRSKSISMLHYHVNMWQWWTKPSSNFW